MTAPAFPVPPGLAARLAGSPLLVLLDVDGTLAPIAPTPAEARVPPRTRRVVEALARCPGVHVGLVSGRAAADARVMVDVAGLWILGNHGMERLDPAGARQVDRAVVPYEPRIARAAAALREATARFRGVLVEDKQLTLSVHHRLADPRVAPELRALVEHVASVDGLRVTQGKEVLELRPPVRVHKGTAILALARELGVPSERGALLYAGDDRTDEDAFELLRDALPGGVTIRVAGEPLPGGTPTQAEFTVADTERLREFLEWLAASR